MASLRFTDVQARPSACLDLTSLGSCPSTSVMGQLIMIDTICSSFRPWLSCEGICWLNTPPNGRYRQL